MDFVERRNDERTLYVVSKDEAWLHFAEMTLRRTDRVKALQSLGKELAEALTDHETSFLLISSELVPDRVKELAGLLGICHFSKVCVLKGAHDDHHRINDKHLKDMGVFIADRPENAKAFHKLLKILCN